MLDLLPGTEVHARGLRWEVVSSQGLGPQTLFRLRGLENAVLGHELDFLHPIETIEPIRHDLRPDRAAPLVNWLVYHQAFLLEQAFGPDALLAVQPGRLRIEPYQLMPVLRAIRMVRVRLQVCDGVGLGKTCQIGLVLTELTARRLVHRILIVSPAGPLLKQWKVEMSERFGVRSPLASPVAEQEAQTPVIAAPVAVRPLRVLLVKDHPVTAKMMQNVLNANGHVVQWAGDVATALELADRNEFDLLMSDPGLPDGSGHDLMRQLRERGHKFPGITLSGYGQEEDIQPSRDAGFAAHLTKPASREAIVEAVAAAVAE